MGMHGPTFLLSLRLLRLLVRVLTSLLPSPALTKVSPNSRSASASSDSLQLFQSLSGTVHPCLSSHVSFQYQTKSHTKSDKSQIANRKSQIAPVSSFLMAATRVATTASSAGDWHALPSHSQQLSKCGGGSVTYNTSLLAAIATLGAGNASKWLRSSLGASVLVSSCSITTFAKLKSKHAINIT